MSDPHPSSQEEARRSLGPRWRLAAWFAIGGLVVVGLLAAAVWFAWLPDHRPELRAGERYGIDVSHHQGAIDWQRVAEDDIAFAYIKATEGGDWVDSEFSSNWSDAAIAGIARGAYHFFTLCTSGESQAANFLAVVPVAAAEFPPAIDLEFAGNCSTRPSPDWLSRELGAFLDAVEEAAGRPAVLYVGDAFERSYGVKSSLDRPLWQFNLARRPPGDWFIWQVSGFAEVDGIAGRVDLDLMSASP